MTKILFLDLDGTVRRTKSGATFINDLYDQELIPGVEDAIARYHDWVIVGVTNQGGVASKSISDCIAEQYRTLELLPSMERIYFCPHVQECWLVTRKDVDKLIESTPRDYRKPETGMIDIALLYLKKPPTKILMVGDHTEDEQCAKNAGIEFIWAEDWRTH